MGGHGYKRYRNYMSYRQQYKVDQIAYPIIMFIIISLISKYGAEILTLAAILIGVRIANRRTALKKNIRIIEIEREPRIPEISTEITEAKTETIVPEININVTDAKTESRGDVYKMVEKKTTSIGYVNRNNQRNNGKTSLPGTDNMQWFYKMECLNCGKMYKANGSDIFQRKCPVCQGGRP